MTIGVCRVGDSFSGTCNNHSSATHFTGTWSGMSHLATADGQSVVLVGDVSPASCGHTAKAVGGASVTSVSGIAVHRSGDSITIVEGSHGSGSSTSGSSVVSAA